MITAQILLARWRLFLARWQRVLEWLLATASTAVLVAAQTDNGWAAVFGKWGPLVTLAVAILAGQIRKAPKS